MAEGKKQCSTHVMALKASSQKTEYQATCTSVATASCMARLNARGVRKYKPLTSREFGAEGIGREERRMVVNHEALHYKSGHVLNHSDLLWPPGLQSRAYRPWQVDTETDPVVVNMKPAQFQENVKLKAALTSIEICFDLTHFFSFNSVNLVCQILYRNHRV